MIQRIQTVYLVLSILLNCSMFATALFKRTVEGPQDWILISITVVAVLSVVVSLWAIFQYPNRIQQIKIIRIAQLFQVMLLGGSFGILFSLGGIGTYLWDEAIGIVLIIAAFMAQYLAVRGIRKDQELIKSMDRLR
ncbi:MAG: hypothetical protein CL672_00230 [Balneola sp.]|nr:hypothetical protein [Balneola sp.]